MYAIVNATVCTGRDTFPGGIAVDGAKIVAMGTELPPCATTIDAHGATLMPGMVDMHTHLREPGYEYKETLETGSAAAVAGGFSQIACMPNTNPVCDNAVSVRYIVERARAIGLAKILPIGAITKGEQGESLAEIGMMAAAGAVAISDDGRPVANAEVMRLALEYASDFNILPLSHCEERSLVQGGVVNEGVNSARAGLRGIPRAAEEVMVARDLVLAGTLGKRVHLCHLSTRGSLQLVREAKKRGVPVTAETCPHYFAGTDDLILSGDPATKVNPPLRTEDDRLAVVEALADGTLDAIATDHAPHHADEKHCEYEKASFGISGLETAFALSYTYLVKSGALDLSALVRLNATNPARLLGVPGGDLHVGGVADFFLADLTTPYRIDPAAFRSKGKNTPFAGWEVVGKPLLTAVDGAIKFREGI